MPKPETGNSHATPPEGLGDSLKSAIDSAILYLQARLLLLKIEAREAGSAIGRKALLYYWGAGLILLSYIFILAAAVSLISRHYELGWELIAFIVAGGHLLLGAVMIAIAKGKFSKPLFEDTCKEFEKDRQWIKNKDNR